MKVVKLYIEEDSDLELVNKVLERIKKERDNKTVKAMGKIPKVKPGDPTFTGGRRRTKTFYINRLEEDCYSLDCTNMAN